MKTVDQLIKENWPKDVPEDCTRLTWLKHYSKDCLERGDKKPCLSCKTFAQLDKKYRKQIGDMDKLYHASVFPLRIYGQ